MTKVNTNQRVILGMSGGVDSTTAALMLQKQGYEVIGYHFIVCEHKRKEAELAQRLADKLGIRLIIEDVSKEFDEIVISDFIKKYESAMTPSPCLVCNPNLKFRKFIETADREGAEHIASGHYARIIIEDGVPFICKAANLEKDQSYMLAGLPASIISRLLLPLGDVSNKEKVREELRNLDFENADQRDSQEICFIEEGKRYTDFLVERNAVNKLGNFIDAEGNIIAKHTGICNYTIGQRKGLGIALGKPAFVTKIDDLSGDITISDESGLYSREAHFKEPFSNLKIDSLIGKQLTAKTRYSSKVSTCTIMLKDGEFYAIFDEQQRAVTPGQYIVFYDGEKVVGVGLIYS